VSADYASGVLAECEKANEQSQSDATFLMNFIEHTLRKTVVNDASLLGKPSNV
jgi:hypothetical protein